MPSIYQKIAYPVLPLQTYPPGYNYAKNNVPYPTGQVLPSSNINPVSMAINFGLLGAAGGLGVAGVTEALRRWRGEKRKPLRGPGVIKHIAVGGLIGTALGAIAGIQASSQAQRPENWAAVLKLLERNAGPMPTDLTKASMEKEANPFLLAALYAALGIGGAAWSAYDAKNNFQQALTDYKAGDKFNGNMSLLAGVSNSALVPLSLASGGAPKYITKLPLLAKVPWVQRLVAKAGPAIATHPKLINWLGRSAVVTPIANYISRGVQDRVSQPGWGSEARWKNQRIFPNTRPPNLMAVENQVRSKLEGLPLWMSPSKPFVDY